MQDQILEYLRECENMIRNDPNVTVLELLIRSLMDMIYFLLDKFEQIDQENQVVIKQLQDELSAVNNNYKQQAQFDMELRNIQKEQVNMMKQLEEQLVLAEQKLNKQESSQNQLEEEIHQRYLKKQRDIEKTYQTMKHDMDHYIKVVQNNYQFVEQLNVELKKENEILQRRINQLEELQDHVIERQQKQQPKNENISGMMKTLQSIGQIQKHIDNSINRTQMTRQYLSMVKVEDYTEDDDRLSTAGGGPTSPGVVQNPYYQFFLLQSQAVKLDLKRPKYLSSSVNHLYGEFLKEKIPFNKWYDRIKNAILSQY
ncbi:hypothetical protein pb186bvf_015039 [Paramecium bursaria]